MGRKKQNPQDSAKRALILKRAAKMFMSQGYTLVSMDALAEAVPVSKRTLYNHFKDKKAIFTAVMEARCQTLFHQLEKSLQGDKSVEETLTQIGRQFLDLVMEADSINIYRTAITESKHFPELGKLFYESGPARSKAVLTDYMNKMHAMGKLRITHSGLATDMFLNMLKGGTHMQRLLGVKKRVSDEEKDEIVHYAVQVFLYGQMP